MKARTRLLCGVMIVASTLLVGCVRVPFSTKHFKYSLDITVAGRRYLIRRDVECYDVVGWNPEVGGWGRETHSSGGESSLVDVGNDFAALVHPKTDCIRKASNAQTQEHPRYVKILKHPADPDMMYVVQGESADPPIIVIREWSERTEHGSGFAPTPDEAQALKQLLGPLFVRAAVRTFPSSEWATSPGVVEYFAQFDKPTPAPSREMPYGPEFVDGFVTFPNWHAQHDAVDKALDYDGTNFVLAKDEKDAERWSRWRPEQLGKPLQRSVRYKSVVFNVAQSRDLYDPENRTIYQFMLRQDSALQ